MIVVKLDRKEKKPGCLGDSKLKKKSFNEHIKQNWHDFVRHDKVMKAIVEVKREDEDNILLLDKREGRCHHVIRI